jgi:hypothetical protein
VGPKGFTLGCGSHCRHAAAIAATRQKGTEMKTDNIETIREVCDDALLNGTAHSAYHLDIIFTTIAPNLGRLDEYGRDVADSPYYLWNERRGQ